VAAALVMEEGRRQEWMSNETLSYNFLSRPGSGFCAVHAGLIAAKPAPTWYGGAAVPVGDYPALRLRYCAENEAHERAAPLWERL